MFELRNITKKFGTEYALRNVCAEIGGGLSFLVGASGSGKTTLLKIISGMEPDFEGEIFFRGVDLKRLNKTDRSGLYNDVFGFVWQDFHLLEDHTVLENVLLPRYLKEELSEKRAYSILKELGIHDLAEEKAAKLSGGQKQRVAIARELMKDPQVILADEPTSALDQKTAGEIMAILRRLSRRCAIIVVTHDTSLIREGDPVYELDKGELTLHPETSRGEGKAQISKRVPRLSWKNALTLACTAISRRPGRAATMIASLAVAAALLLTSLSGALTDSSQSVFDELFATYGESLLDISLYSSFMSAGGGDEDGPKADVTQDLDGLFERYREDERVEHVLFAQAFSDIQVELGGRSYSVETTNNSPIFRRLTAGRMPMGDGMEIAVPEVFVQSIGMTNEEILGMDIHFSGSVYNWESGQPVKAPMSCTAEVVGVVDTTMVYEYGGQVYETAMGDSFFFSPRALAAIRREADMSEQPGGFYIRCKTPADVIAVKDELNAQGIVPLGRFELIEDMVRLNQQTAQQSGTAVWVVGVLAMILVLSVAVLTAILRRSEFAVLSISGFAASHIVKVIGAEALAQGVYAAAGFAVFSPLLNLGTRVIWSVSILEPKLLLAGMGLCFGLSLLAFGVTAAIAAGVRPQICLRTGDR